MAIHIEFRNGTAASWTSTNPVLSQGEPGVETDTGKFKIGDGSTAWSSLAYQGSTGATQTESYRSFGDGADGNVTISTGTTILGRDMYYNNLTMSGTGILNTNGYKVFVKGVLDITAAATAAIQWNGTNGTSGSGATGGGAMTAQTGNTVAGPGTGGAGTTATTANGSNGTAAANFNGNGGVGGAAGGGGTGTSGGGGAGGAGRTPTSAPSQIPIRFYSTNLWAGNTLLGGGGGGGGGAAGAGDGTNTGGGGGTGGNGGGVMGLYVNTILKSSSTLSGTIQAKGGNGGNGGSSSAGVTGGGGGGGGGAGGWIYMCYNNLFGPVVTNVIQASGGSGGTGGNGFGTGGTGGAGGNAGAGGRVAVINIPTNSSQASIDQSNTSLFITLVGTSPTITTGGDGGMPTISQLSL